MARKWSAIICLNLYTIPIEIDPYSQQDEKLTAEGKLTTTFKETNQINYKKKIEWIWYLFLSILETAHFLAYPSMYVYNCGRKFITSYRTIT